MMKKVKTLININQKGTFTDDAGNNCWYIDDLLKALEDLTK